MVRVRKWVTIVVTAGILLVVAAAVVPCRSARRATVGARPLVDVWTAWPLDFKTLDFQMGAVGPRAKQLSAQRWAGSVAMRRVPGGDVEMELQVSCSQSGGGCSVRGLARVHIVMQPGLEGRYEVVPGPRERFFARGVARLSIPVGSYLATEAIRGVMIEVGGLMEDGRPTVARKGVEVRREAGSLVARERSEWKWWFGEQET